MTRRTHLLITVFLLTLGAALFIIATASLFTHFPADFTASAVGVLLCLGGKVWLDEWYRRWLTGFKRQRLEQLEREAGLS